MTEFANVRELGAYADGVHDDAAVLNSLIRSGCRKLLIPQGRYLLGSTLILESGTEIAAEKDAYMILAPGAQKSRRDFLAANGSSDKTAKNISISGGVWDGNSMHNSRGDNLFDPSATSGALFSFSNVKNLSLSDMKLKNPLCYYLRFCRAENVTIDGIVFESEDVHINQDGIHLAGFCSRFTIRNLRGVSGSPGDDFIALNADDCLTRQESFDMVNGPQKDILIENIHADECHCFLRLLSVESPIENVTVRNVSGCCRGTAVNMDAARYCRVPLFSQGDEICKNGVGRLRNVLIENICVGRSQVTREQFITAETNAQNLEIRNFEAVTPYGGDVIEISNLAPHTLKYRSEKITADETLLLNERRSFTEPRFETFILSKI